jgi:hypothetical protein
LVGTESSLDELSFVPWSGIANPLKFYPKLTFAISCLTVREDPNREENAEVLAKGGKTHAETTN